MDGPATTRVHGYQAHAEHRLLLPAQQRLPPSASDSSNAGIGHDAGVRRLRIACVFEVAVHPLLWDQMITIIWLTLNSTSKHGNRMWEFGAT